jgi:hypothetical protein
LAKLLGDLGRKIGNTVPTACQDWAATKAAYRFFSNPRVDEGIILAGHFAATKARFAKTCADSAYSASMLTSKITTATVGGALLQQVNYAYNDQVAIHKGSALKKIKKSGR